MSVATLNGSRSSDSEKYWISIQGNMSESPTDEPSKAEKKREYNRNAQRVFRQRRKEHLKNLEAAQKEQSSVQSEEIKRLRDENVQLYQENQTLRRAYSSGSSSPVALTTPAVAGPSTFAPFPNPPTFIPAPPQGGSTSLSNAVSAITPNLCVIAPHNLLEIRRSLHVLFAPILEAPVISNPQTHLAALAMLAPQLPSALKPTELQLSTPHHAFIDLIPSPSLRERLIGIGPANASAFMTQVCTIACDIEDHGQMVIWGEDWLNEFSWEFSEAVLERWGGWLLDRRWGQRANFWRRQRGLPVLPAWEC